MFNICTVVIQCFHLLIIKGINFFVYFRDSFLDTVFHRLDCFNTINNGMLFDFGFSEKTSNDSFFFFSNICHKIVLVFMMINNGTITTDCFLAGATE